MRSLKTFFISVLLFLFSQSIATADTRLLMFEEDGCPYCIQWKAEVGIIYSKTEEGKQAPVSFIDISDPLPENISIGIQPVYTPTFILLENNKEVGRIEGYPGEDFFYGLLAMLLKRLPPHSPNS